MPATSKRQKVLFCVALQIKLGKTPKSYSKEAARMAEETSEATLREYCEGEVKS